MKIKGWPTKISILIEDDETAPQPVRAASLALALLKHAKADNFGELEAKMVERDPLTVALVQSLRLSPLQRQIMADHPALVRAVGAGKTASKTAGQSTLKRRTIAACPSCPQWVFLVGARKTKCPQCAVEMVVAKPSSAHEAPALSVAT